MVEGFPKEMQMVRLELIKARAGGYGANSANAQERREASGEASPTRTAQLRFFHEPYRSHYRCAKR
jgi:hypothetical protein